MYNRITSSIEAGRSLLTIANDRYVAAFVATLLIGYAEQAGAQAGGAEPIDEIVVTTARRREESLQEVPLAITVLSGVDLERVGAADIIEIGKKSPNVTLEVSRGTNSTLSSFIRGVGQQDPVAGYEAGVGLYVDDVYFNRPHAAVLELYEVERVEVLRGPQGTLYGRNTIGGAIKYVTKPLEEETRARARLSVGTDNQLDGLFTASGSLSDSFRVGGTVAKFTRDGFGNNLFLGTEQYDKDILGATPDGRVGRVLMTCFSVFPAITPKTSPARSSAIACSSAVLTATRS